MGNKYIIELEDKPFHNEDGDSLCRVKGFNSLVFDMTGISKLAHYHEPDLEQVRADAYEDGYKTAKVQCNIQAEKDMREVGERHYQRGLADAWEAARKISLAKIDGGFSWESMNNMFGTDSPSKIYKTFTVSEAIEKIRKYEQRQEEQIQVGDEVRNIKNGKNGWIAVVCNIDGECMTLMDTNGALGDGYDVNRFTKTGRHFPEIAAVLEKMRGEQDG